jgi:hypothetical protein
MDISEEMETFEDETTDVTEGLRPLCSDGVGERLERVALLLRRLSEDETCIMDRGLWLLLLLEVTLDTLLLLLMLLYDECLVEGCIDFLVREEEDELGEIGVEADF